MVKQLLVYQVSTSIKQEIMPKITQATISSLKPTGSVFYIRDSDLKGFGIKITAKGQATFIVEGRIKKGPTYRIPLGSVELTSLREARTQAYDILASAKKGIDPRFDRVVAPTGSQTLKWCLNQHLSIRVIKPSTQRTYKNQIRNAFKDWYNLPVEQITAHRIAERRVKLIHSGKSEDYVASCFRTLKAVLGNSDIAVNPVTSAAKKAGFSVQSSPTEKEEFLYEQQISALIRQYTILDDTLAEEYTTDDIFLGKKPTPNIIAASLYLMLIGGREQDVYNLTWDMVDKEQKTINYPSRSKKEKRPHIIPLVGMVEDIIDTQPTHTLHPHLVFGMTHEMFRRRYDNQVRPITKLTSKSLRKTWAEHVGLDGYDAIRIGQGLNHSHAVHGTVTSRHYSKGSLIKQKQLKEMFTDIQTRYFHYALGYKLDDDKKNDQLEKLVQLKDISSEQVYIHLLLKKFPKFYDLIKDKTTEDRRQIVEMINSMGIA